MTSCGSLYSLNLSDETLSRGGPAVETLSHLLLSNGRAILDFSIGDNYSMILGDIIDQVPYSGETLNTL